MKKIKVHSASGTYEILYGRGVAAQSPKAVAGLGRQGAIFLISSPRVWKYLGARMDKLFKGVYRATLLFDDREAAKNLSTVEHTCVVGDVAGFVAASYARGIELVHIPTTLVAQVDSAIGGKTGVNLPEGKNLVGAFYPAKLVIADPELLRTLPPREFRSGVYEIIKYGVIGDAKLFRFLEQKMEKVLRRDPAALDFIIERSILQKARVVSRDERESGLREILNFGHTFAHALESVTRYRKYLHGEAVGWGMIAASTLAASSRIFPAKDLGRLISLIARVGPLPAWPDASVARLIAAMQADKKTRGGRLRFVLPEKIGKVRCGVEVDSQILSEVLRECAAAGPRK